MITIFPPSRGASRVVAPSVGGEGRRGGVDLWSRDVASRAYRLNLRPFIRRVALLPASDASLLSTAAH